MTKPLGSDLYAPRPRGTLRKRRRHVPDDPGRRIELAIRAIMDARQYVLHSRPLPRRQPKQREVAPKETDPGEIAGRLIAAVDVLQTLIVRAEDAQRDG